MNIRYLRALKVHAAQNASYDTPRRVEMMACSFVRDNIAHALGMEVVDPSLVMSETQVAMILGEEVTA